MEIMIKILNDYARQILSALPANRLLALDVFRGLTITAMVLVNNPGSWSYVYPPMLHAEWHGWTPTDLIFPFFVFIVGVSISIVMSRELQKGTNKLLLIKNAGIRAGKLFLLGLFLALFYFNFVEPNYSWLESQLFSIRVMGVLQRLGLVFFFTVLIVIYFKPLGRFFWMLGILVSYWLLLTLVPYSTPNGDLVTGSLAFGNNLHAWLDSYVFAEANLYYRDAKPFAFDPEGLLSTLPAIAGALAGVFTGDVLTDKTRSLQSKCQLMLISGLTLLLVGELWGLVFPINKALWTSSYVLMSTGWALVILAALTWLIDIKGVKQWSAPFVVFGANAIGFYMFSAVLARLLIMIPMQETSVQGWLFSFIYQPVFGNYSGSLMFAISFCLFCYLVMHWLYKKQIFFKV